MADELNVRIDLGQITKLLDAYSGARVPHTLAAGMREGILLMVRDVIVNRLSGQYLRRRTGTLQRSVAASPRVAVTSMRVTGSFGSNLEYARAHELGFRGSVGVRAHTRQTRHGAVAVRAHTRFMRLRARHFFRDTLRANVGKLNLRVKRALLILLRTGEVPTGSAVRAGFTG